MTAKIADINLFLVINFPFIRFLLMYLINFCVKVLQI